MSMALTKSSSSRAELYSLDPTLETVGEKGVQSRNMMLIHMQDTQTNDVHQEKR